MRRSNFAPSWREVGTQQKGGDNINLTQAEIDAIVKATVDNGSEKYKEISGHGLFCIYCKAQGDSIYYPDIDKQENA